MRRTRGYCPIFQKRSKIIQEDQNQDDKKNLKKASNKQPVNNQESHTSTPEKTIKRLLENRRGTNPRSSDTQKRPKNKKNEANRIQLQEKNTETIQPESKASKKNPHPEKKEKKTKNPRKRKRSKSLKKGGKNNKREITLKIDGYSKPMIKKEINT